ncbi:hypothetical protein NIES4073_41370 [Kalymmatonema gypsitolerans NIES-4073]|nr:hypothetical protein NIES4073_41370 [Scytonema sp. NIES-4073]
MPRLRYDEFIYCLQLLQDNYPEFAELLELLIEEIAKGKLDSLQEKLTILIEEDW